MLDSYPSQRRLFYGGAALARGRTGLEEPVLDPYPLPAPPILRQRGLPSERTGLEEPVLDSCPSQRRLFYGGAALASPSTYTGILSGWCLY